MARPARGTISNQEQIVDTLIREIVSGRRPVGSALPSLRALAGRFGTSIRPAQHAIVILAERGYVERRHGSGTYVLDRPEDLDMTHSAMLCVDATGHVFGDLTALLTRRLHDLGLLTSVLDTGHGNVAAFLRRAQYSGARFILMQGGGGFPIDALEPEAIRCKHLIALLSWESNALLDRVHRIVVDHAAGSAVLTDHLRTAGHRHLLLAGPDNMLQHAGQWDGQGDCPPSLNVLGTGMAARWQQQGGLAIPFDCFHDRPDGPACDEDRLCAILDGPDAPTAVVGLRDVDAWDVRETLHRCHPGALDRLTFLGNSDTPWSRTSRPPFTTLNWNLESIADRACDIIRDVEAGKTVTRPVVHLIPPRLVAR